LEGKAVRSIYSKTGIFKSAPGFQNEISGGLTAIQVLGRRSLRGRRCILLRPSRPRNPKRS